MDDLIDDIMHIIHKCHPTESMKLKKRRKKTIPSNSSLKEIQYDIEQLLANKTCNAGGVEYSNLNKMMACCNLKVYFFYGIEFCYDYTDSIYLIHQIN